MLLLVLVSGSSALEHAVAVLLDLGIAASVVESRPLSTVLRTELPIFTGLASMLPQSPDGRLLVSVTTASLADRAAGLLAKGQERVRPTIVASIALRRIVDTRAAPSAPRRE